MNNKIEFICVGFHKCGTTTIDSILRQNKEIYLPDYLKETQFCSWYMNYQNPLEIFNSRYFAKSKNSRHCGMIEPEFITLANVVQKYWGSDIKLIFIMRNPVDRLFSFFKMKLERGDCLEFYHQKYKKNNGSYDISKMFDDYVFDYIRNKNKSKFYCDYELGNYIRWIKDYCAYFSTNQMRFYIFEEFIKSPEPIINDMQRFIGVHEQKLNCRIRKNEGHTIAKNKFAAKINKHYYKKEYRYRADEKYRLENFHRFEHNFGILKKMTNYLYSKQDAYISKKARRICESYYRQGKDELAEFLNKDLNSVWFT